MNTSEESLTAEIRQLEGTTLMAKARRDEAIHDRDCESILAFTDIHDNCRHALAERQQALTRLVARREAIEEMSWEIPALRRRLAQWLARLVAP